MKLESIDDVVERQLCTGCGVCAYLEPERYRMVNSVDYGNRPIKIDEPRETSFEGIGACPGIYLNRDLLASDSVGSTPKDYFLQWGPVLGVWEGCAADADVQFAGSSGGAATAIALYCIEVLGMDGALHIAGKQTAPLINETVLSKSREELLARTGSRYSPASPAEGLGLIENSPGQCVFIGKPCDAAAVQKARTCRTELDNKLGLVVSFFCAGVPSTRGTLELLKTQGIVDPKQVTGLRYRGNGWPGSWVVSYQNDAGEQENISLGYEESWGFLEKYRQWRCYICPDHTGEFSDIAVGDPWYREVVPGEPGSSLLVARTKLGYETLMAAYDAGYIALKAEDSSLLPRSQPNLCKTRSALWGRLITLRLMNAAVPRYTGFGLLHSWLKGLTGFEKIRSITGTIRRVVKRRLWKKITVVEWTP